MNCRAISKLKAETLSFRIIEKLVIMYCDLDLNNVCFSIAFKEKEDSTFSIHHKYTLCM